MLNQDPSLIIPCMGPCLWWLVDDSWDGDEMWQEMSTWVCSQDVQLVGGRFASDRTGGQRGLERQYL